MSSAIVQEGRFADDHELRFQGAKLSNMDSAEQLRNRIFMLGNVHIWVMPSC